MIAKRYIPLALFLEASFEAVQRFERLRKVGKWIHLDTLIQHQVSNWSRSQILKGAGRGQKYFHRFGSLQKSASSDGSAYILSTTDWKKVAGTFPEVRKLLTKLKQMVFALCLGSRQKCTCDIDELMTNQVSSVSVTMSFHLAFSSVPHMRVEIVREHIAEHIWCTQLWI